MEVDGKQRDKDEHTSDDPICQPCSEGGDTMTAVKFCSVCKEWMCCNCTNCHRRFKATRTHTLLDKDAVSHSTTEHEPENITYHCAIHPTELIKYYCPKHSMLHCGDCAASVSCKMNKLSSMSSSIRNNEEFVELQSNIVQLVKDADALESKVNTMIESAVEQGTSHLDQVARHEQFLIEKIKTHSASLKDDINIATSEAKYQLGSVIDMCADIRSVGEQFGQTLDGGVNGPEVFIAFIKAKPVFQSKSVELIEAGNQTNVKQYKFKKCVDLETMLQTTKSFGTYVVEEKDAHPALSPDEPEIQTLNVQQHSEDTGCKYLRIFKPDIFCS